MAKVIELGVVKEIHSSGIVETNKGVRSMVKANIGDRLVQDVVTGVISVATKKTAKKPIVTQPEQPEPITNDGDE